MQPRRFILGAVFGCLIAATVSQGAEWGLKEGTPDLKSATALAFGPDGILFIGDTRSAKIFAIGTGDTEGDPAKVKLEISDLNGEIAKALGAESVTINDLAVNPLTGHVFLAVAKGQGPKAAPAIVRLDAQGKPSEIGLTKVPFQQVELPDAPEDKEIQRGNRSMNPRNDAITDLAYAEGKVYVSGLAAGTSPSSVHQIPFPFAEGLTGTSVEIYHAAHGRSEDYAAIRTFVPMNINGEPTLLAGFVCTPLVRFPVDALKPGSRTKGTTVAELGNRNRPLDMITYQKDGKTFLLLSNSARGVMKISTENIARNEGLTTPVTGGGTAGQPYETVKELDGVTQLDKLNDTHLVVVVQSSPNSLALRTVDLP